MAIVTQATKFKVPRENNSVLIWSDTPLLDLLRQNQNIRNSYPSWLRELTLSARHEILDLLRLEAKYQPCCCSCASQNQNEAKLSGSTGNLDSSSPDLSAESHWVLGGHQPELFHPGVWYKNFYLDWTRRHLQSLSEKTLGLHLVVDHDLARSTTIRTMRREKSQASPNALGDSRLLPSLHTMPVSTATPSPWEATCYEPQQEQAWQQWIDGLVDDSESLGINAILKSRREQFLNLLRESSNIGVAFSRFRQIVERANGCENLELAMSKVSNTKAFGEFLRRCLIDSEQFLEIYNSARDNFRKERSITNPTQPVAELHKVGEWLELPFWIYRLNNEVVHRNKLWVRIIDSNQVELSDAPNSEVLSNNQADFEHSVGAELTWANHRETGLSHQQNIRQVYRLDAQSWTEDWQAGLEDGVCIRPRALTNTLFLRYVVADLFVHGIGGGIYDAVTDEIASRLWNVQPLAMQVVSASLFLPVQTDENGSESNADLAELDEATSAHANAIHRMRSAPETFLDLADAEEQELLAQHKTLLSQRPAKGARKAWHWEMKQLRHRIRSRIADRAEQLKLDGRNLLEKERQTRLLRSRENSFILFPESDIAQRLKGLLPERLS